MLLVGNIRPWPSGLHVAGGAGAKAVRGIDAGEDIDRVNTSNSVGKRVGERPLMVIADVLAGDERKCDARASCARKGDGGKLHSGRGAVGVHRSEERTSEL